MIVQTFVSATAREIFVAIERSRRGGLAVVFIDNTELNKQIVLPFWNCGCGFRLAFAQRAAIANGSIVTANVRLSTDGLILIEIGARLVDSSFRQDRAERTDSLARQHVDPLRWASRGPGWHCADTNEGTLETASVVDIVRQHANRVCFP